MTATCPACGTASIGRFCRACGTALKVAGCGGCGAPLPSDARYCSQCGTAAGADAPRADRWSWFFAGGAVALGVGGLVLGLAPARTAPPPTPIPAAPEASAPAPDISAMTPRERFDRLYNRIMRAAESGDENTVTTFAPMAVQAYAMLDQVDVDARYHLALIQLHSGALPDARAQADSIDAMIPGHLFGYMVHGAIARYQKNQVALDATYRGFLAHYAAEQQSGRPEYAEHTRALEEFAGAARAATAGSGS